MTRLKPNTCHATRCNLMLGLQQVGYRAPEKAA